MFPKNKSCVYVMLILKVLYIELIAEVASWLINKYKLILVDN